MHGKDASILDAMTKATIAAFILTLTLGCQTTDKAGLSARQGIIVDSENNPELIEKSGFWQFGASGGDYKYSTLWAYKGKGECSFRWRPEIPYDGKYTVSLQFGGDPDGNHAANAPFAVIYDGGREEHTVDQSSSSKGWKVLGTYRFKAGKSGYVEINNKASGNVVADAVKFDPVK